jgi:hypothetical protein
MGGALLAGETGKPVSLPFRGCLRSSGKPAKYERLGLSKPRVLDSQTIAKHPEIVEKGKAKARANEDIPTKTAVLLLC